MSKPIKTKRGSNAGRAKARKTKASRAQPAIAITIDDIDLPLMEDNFVSTGAAADAADLDDDLRNLPRVLRTAALVVRREHLVRHRLVADIDALCPGLGLNAAFARHADPGTALALATELDHRAASEDRPELRSLADCVRLICLPLPRTEDTFDDHNRVAKTLFNALRRLPHDDDHHALASQLETFCVGWAAMPGLIHLISHQRPGFAADHAFRIGELTAVHRVDAAEAALIAEAETRDKKAHERATQAEAAVRQRAKSPSDNEAVPENHLVVATLSDEQLKNPKMKEITGPFKGVINVPLPLIVPPPLHEVRRQLLFEFPYASDVVDFALTDLVGRATVKLRPLLLVGDPGGGKSRFARRLAETLGVSCWRTDAARSDGASFAGTDKRWYSAEPCHPFLAIGQGKIANPMVLIDELEKAATRNDYGRLWDSLLGFLELETASRYPDPALQINLDLSGVSYVATANSLDPLPSPIRDRFRVIAFPKPQAGDLNALLPAIFADLAGERGLDPRWITPIDGIEHAAIAATWRGGSVRRLRRIVEAVLRERERNAARH